MNILWVAEWIFESARFTSRIVEISFFEAVAAIKFLAIVASFLAGASTLVLTFKFPFAVATLPVLVALEGFFAVLEFVSFALLFAVGYASRLN